MMDQFIIEWYKTGLYTIDDMRLAVETGNLTKEEFKEATGIDYDAPTTSQAPASQASAAPSQASQASSVTA